MSKKKIIVLGAGRIGVSIGEILQSSGSYQVTIADRQAQALTRIPALLQERSLQLDVYDPKSLKSALEGHEAVISACSFHENPVIARAALEAGISYFDLTEDVACTRVIQELAGQAREGQVFMPQCGLAPGFIGILGNNMFQRFDRVHTLKMRVGALPIFPNNQMMYNLTWSTDGLINEYCNPCEAIKNGEYAELQPLEGLENFSLDGVQYEAFNTSGGLGTLCETLNGKVHDLTYKTIRYPGHCFLVDFLLTGLRLGENAERRQLLKQILEHAVPVTAQDLVLVMVSATGEVGGQMTQKTDVFKVAHDIENGREWSAIQRTTASGLCVVVDLFFENRLKSRGFIRQEDVLLEDFLANRFATCYAQGKHV
jgi:saccharopine dehydrogenase-like NADP-dependent oxidoreductase